MLSLCAEPRTVAGLTHPLAVCRHRCQQVAQWAEVVRRMVRDQQELGKAVSDQTILRFLVKDKSDSLGQDVSDAMPGCGGVVDRCAGAS